MNLEIELINDVAMEVGLRFAIREGGRTVGAGRVTEIMSDVGQDGEKGKVGSKKGK